MIKAIRGIRASRVPLDDRAIRVGRVCKVIRVLRGIRV